MSERCQTKLSEKNVNNDILIYFGIFCTTLAVLYFYRFHFATIAFSYVLGCLACYYGLNSRILQEYIYKLNCHFVGETNKFVEEIEPVQSCETCGSKECSRHDSSMSAEPWVGLQIHKQLDQAIEDFYNTILDQFISSWYNKITLQPFFVDELRHQLRYASACLLNRALKINYSELITCRLVPCALQHYCKYASGEHGEGAPQHPALANRQQELNYLRAVTDAIMPYLLKHNDLQNSVFCVLIREIFAGWVLLSLTDVLADPHILNTLIVLATGTETMAPLPATPDYKVEFLETFVRQTESIYTRRTKLLRVELDLVISEQDYFYAFMQFLKSTSHIHLLQFYNDIKSFQTKLLDPELSARAQESLAQEARSLHAQHARPLRAHRALVACVGALLKDAATVKELQTSRALYQAARQSHALLEKVMLPRFLHSEEFYKLLIGSRIPTGFQKQMKKPQERLLNQLKFGHRLKGALRSQNLDGQVLDSFTNSEDPDGDGVDNIDILKYLDNLATEESLKGQDLSSYKVVLTDVATKLQAAPRRGTVRVFTIAVHRVESGAAASLWSVERSEHDFHLLRSKLHEFHGDRLLHDLHLPSRRDNSPLENLRYKYEDFLQRLLQKSLLQTSELLRLFLSEEGDFSLMVAASTLTAASTDIANIYQSVAHRLRKEKGQHLDTFLTNLLVSSDIERYQALKLVSGRDIEEGQEVCEEAGREEGTPRERRVRSLRSELYTYERTVPPSTAPSHAQPQYYVRGFSETLMYFLRRVVRARGGLVRAAGGAVVAARALLDAAAACALRRALAALLTHTTCTRLARLLALAQRVIFNKKSSPRSDGEAVRLQAHRQLLEKVPPAVALVAGPGLLRALDNAFDIIQNPHLNKQLVYNLLDLCVMELFPELEDVESRSTNVPKS